MLDKKIWNSAPYPFDRGGWSKSVSTGKSSVSASHSQLESAKAVAGWDGKDQSYAHHFSSLPPDSISSQHIRSYSRESSSGARVQKDILKNTIQKHSSISDRIFAAQADNVQLLQSMLDADPGTKLEDRDGLGRTVLHASAASGCMEVTKFLSARCSTQAKANFQAAERDSFSLCLACHSENLHFKPCELIDQASPRSFRSQPSTSCKSETSWSGGRGGRVPRLPTDDWQLKRLKWERTCKVGELHECRSVNFLNLRDHAGDTALHLAAAQGHNEVVEHLLSRGIEMEIRNFAGRTALHLACLNCNLDCIKTLVEAGANARMRDKEGRRPLDMSSEPLVHSLLREKAGGEVAVRGGPTPFGWGDHDTFVDANAQGTYKVESWSRRGQRKVTLSEA